MQVLAGGTVRTVHPSGPATAEALAVDGDRIVAVGDEVEMVAAAGPRAEWVDLHGACVLPGFVDAHQHPSLIATDEHVGRLALPAGARMTELLGVIASLVAEGDGWVRAHGFDPLGLVEGRGPTAAELDAICQDRPVIALSATFHDASVNSAGLMALGIGPGTPDPPGGQIIRDRRGRPTGALVESAAFLAEAASRRDLLGRDGAEEAWIGRLERYAVTLLRAGITRVGDAAVPPDAMALYARAAAEDRLPLTVHRMPVGHSIPDPRAEPPVLGSGPERAPAGPAKLLADGGERCALCLTPRQAVVTAGSLLRALALGRDAVGRRTPRSLLLALAGRGGMLRPTGDGRLGNGIRVLDDAALRQAVEAAARAGTQVAVHAIGNGAVGATLDALERSGTLAALPGSPRIEHAMIIDAALARRMGDSGVMAVVQGSFVTALGDDLARLALPDPLRLLPFGTLAAAGVPLAFGSDHPAAPVDMIAAIRAAVTRRTAGGLVLDPAEALTVSQALEAATRGGAAALGVDGLVGSLAPGMVADLVVLSADPVAVGPDHLAGVRVLATAVGGDLRWWEPL